MKYLFLALTFGLILNAYSQCNTTFKKLLPERFINNNDRFGSDLDANSQYTIVTAEDSDTLGITYAGAAFLYEKTPVGWAFRAMLTPSDPAADDFFGNDVSIDSSGNTVDIINRRYKNGGVYIFEKPSGGWASMTETVNVKLPDYLESYGAVDISDDGSTIAVASPNSTRASIYVFRKPSEGWSNAVAPQEIKCPLPGDYNFFGMDVLLKDQYLYTSSDNDPTGPGIYVYKDNGINYQFLSKLSTTITDGQIGKFGGYLATYGDLIATVAFVTQIGYEGEKLFVYKKNGEWADMTEISQIKIREVDFSSNYLYPIQFISDTELAVSYVVHESDYYTGKLDKITATDISWSAISRETIFQEEGLPAINEFSNQMVWNGTDLIRSVGLKKINDKDRYSLYH